MGDRYLVVDVGEQKLVEISQTAVGSEFDSALGDFLSNYDVTRVREGAKSGGAAQILVELAGGKLMEVDRSSMPRRRPEMVQAGLKGSDQKDKLTLAMLRDWIVTADGKDVVGYADLSLGDADFGPAMWRNGFVRFSLQSPKEFRAVGVTPFPGDVRVSMDLTYPLMASIGSTAYIAQVGDGRNQMSLWQFGPEDAELQEMKAFPAYLKNKPSPVLPSVIHWEDLPGLMKAAEDATMPAGLYAWDNALFLLWRTAAQGQRRWFLSRIDPATDPASSRVLWTVQVPGSVHHMMVIPGPQEWAFLEKGPMVAPGHQVTHHIRFVKSSRLLKANSPNSLKSLCN